jgi:hypothetical protein
VTALAIVLAATSLQISIWPNGEGQTPKHTFTLKCAPVGGTLPNRRTACTKLMAMKNPFAPVRKDLVCTQVYGGPAEAQITGRFRGAPVRARFNLRDGCQIGRWNRLRFILGTASNGS